MNKNEIRNQFRVESFGNICQICPHVLIYSDSPERMVSLRFEFPVGHPH